MTTTLTIAPRFCGPPDSANGGYCAGRLAAAVNSGPGAAVEVTLRAPVPLARSLAVVAGGDGEVGAGEVELRDGDLVVATARVATLELDVVARLAPLSGAGVRETIERAHAVAATSPMLRAPDAHPFPGCFVCGTDRLDGDGLRLFPARLPGSDLYAVVWTPAEVAPEFVWSALDCPSSFPMYLDEDPFEGPCVLGRITARIDALPEIGEDHVVVSWREAVEGRKLITGSALLDADGRVLAAARATWIRIAVDPAGPGPHRSAGAT